MFKQEKYLKKDKEYIFNFIKTHPFATFILNGEGILATHIPVLAKGDPENFILYGHIANKNEQYGYLKDGLEALVIFHGAQSYISSSWYKDIDISTWDYSAVHVNVKLKIQSTLELEESLRNLIHTFESDKKCPIFYEDLPRSMVEDHLPMITGFWMEPFKVDAIAKLHQGFDKEDVQSVIDHLEQEDDMGAKKTGKDIKREHGL